MTATEATKRISMRESKQRIATRSCTKRTARASGSVKKRRMICRAAARPGRWLADAGAPRERAVVGDDDHPLAAVRGRTHGGTALLGRVDRRGPVLLNHAAAERGGEPL